MIALKDVEAAQQRLQGQIARTPLIHSETLSKLTGAEIHLKFENLQYTGSFKQRGALNKLLSLSREERTRGVIAVSAGNHAQGVAYHAGQLGIAATIVMPNETPEIKASRTREFGAEVILSGATFAEATAEMERRVAVSGQVLIHPYDDELVIAGQGTVGLELLSDDVDFDALVVPIGGGGLISGIATATKALRPDIDIIGVQSDRYPGMARYAGRWDFDIPGGTSIAEGIAVVTPGTITRDYVARYVDDILVVEESKIEEAIALLLQIEKTLCEGAGAVGLAAIRANRDRFADKRVGLILSGGNIDNRLLLALLQRQQVRDGKLLHLRMILPDRTGTLGELCTAIGACGGNINSVTHDRTFPADNARSARVQLEIELTDPAIAAVIFDKVGAMGLRCERLE